MPSNYRPHRQTRHLPLAGNGVLGSAHHHLAVPVLAGSQLPPMLIYKTTSTSNSHSQWETGKPINTYDLSDYKDKWGYVYNMFHRQ